ncbi:hypothetical protein BASA60_010003, partial [Batrachochytrium salamandrivorans]
MELYATPTPLLTRGPTPNCPIISDEWSPCAGHGTIAELPDE